MNRWSKYGRRLLVVFFVGAVLIAGGCKGTDSREAVDDTVETMAGKKDLEHFQQMKDDLEKIQNQQANRYRQLDPAEDKE